MDELQDSLNFNKACIANCRQLGEFLDATVRPIIERKSNNMAYGNVCSTLLLRVRAWLGTLSKLDSPADFQAASAASRATFETAIDMVLLFHEEKQNIAKLLAWERSTKLKAAERMVVSKADPHASEFIRRYQATIRTERNQVWPTRNGKQRDAPDRWTGRDLRKDAVEAEKYLSSGFVAFYLERYSLACWHVHGSGATGIWDMPASAFPDICSNAMYDACQFGLVCAEYALKLFDAYDEISEARVTWLRQELPLNAHAIWKQYDS